MTGEELIRKYEGLKLIPYQDSKGVWTIGIGTTRYPDGRAVTRDDEPISELTAYAYLNDFLAREVRPVISAMNRKFSPPQIAALESLIYNTGRNFKTRCPKLYKAILDNDLITCYYEWDFGIKDGLGLLRRRAHELQLFMEGASSK